MKRKAVLLLFFALGFFSILAQTLIIREFIVSFGGNELGIGLFYFFWLFWVGAGSLLVLTKLGRLLHKHFLKIAFLYPVIAFLEIVLFVSLRRLAHLYWWEFFSLERVFLYLLGFTALISFFTGIIFTVAVLWLKEVKEEETSSLVTRAYVFESLGSFAAGALVTLLIIKLVPPLVILIAASICFCCAGFIASIFFKKHIAAGLNVGLLIVLLAFIFMPQKAINFFDNLRAKNIFPEGKFLSQVYTPYQHLFVTKLKNQLVVLSGGEVVSSLPQVVDADKQSALFIAQNPSAKNILIFGIGAENLIASLLKFPVENITYCLEDKVYYDVIFNNAPAQIKSALTDKRLNVVFMPPRLLLRQSSGNPFDLVVVYTPDPSNLVLNAFFTKEFYQLLSNNLTQRGIFATRIISAENFIGSQLRNYGSSVYYTLREVFPKIVITPGKINWFLAGRKESLLVDDSRVLEERFEKIKPRLISFAPQAFASIFLKERVDFTKQMYVDNALFKKTKLINTDNKPLTFFLDILVMARYSQGALVKFFKGALFVGMFVFLIPVLVFLIARIYFLLRIENVKDKRLAFNSKLFQFFSGFLGFAFHLSLIFLFQNRFGTIFQLIGLVNALFMLGLCSGAFLGKSFLRRVAAAKVVVAVLSIEALLILSAYPLFTQVTVGFDKALFVLFVIFFFVAGSLTGASYPLVSKLLQDNNLSLTKVAVSLEALDHWGGSCAGILAGLFMLPLLGVFKTLLLLSIICLILIFIFGAELVPVKLLRKERVPQRLSFPYIRTFYCLVVISICFLVISYLLERKSNLWREPALQLTIEGQDCRWQQHPFAAYVCQSKEGREYVLDSKDYASHIKGFGGHINLKIRITDRGQIKEIKVIEHKETTQYAKNIDTFLSQFGGRFMRQEFSLDTVDAISGATVTSTAIVDIVNEVKQKVFTQLEEGPPEQVVRRGAVVNLASLCLIFFTAVSVILYIFFPHQVFWRKIYLTFVVVILGVGFNLTFSIFHLANLLTFNIPAGKILSHMLIYATPLVLGVLLGQFWCGWLCPFGSLQELLGSSRLCSQPSETVDRRLRFFKYIFLTVVIVVVSVNRDAFLFKQEPLSVFFLNPFRFSKDKVLALTALFFSIFFLRFWCRYFCACGAALSLFNKIALFRKFFIKKYKNCPRRLKDVSDIDCIQCNVCMSSPGDRDEVNEKR
ncbi:MAG: FMN-binding protein [Candidatus Omnitrophota bacterium]|nr:MAG: FMN-binding protein [Candidatus Omnitrophota bacterium]